MSLVTLAIFYGMQKCTSAEDEYQLSVSILCSWVVPGYDFSNSAYCEGHYCSTV